MRAWMVVPSVCLVMLACGDVQAPSGAVTERVIAPMAANPLIRNWTAEHYVWLPSADAANGKIMLLLPGTGGAPRDGRLVGMTAARVGYRAIGLMYADDRAVVDECQSDPDPACMALMRAEIIAGGDQSPHVSVDVDNSIDGRLADLIRYLSSHFADEGWGDFLTAQGALRWDRIAVSGLSQGGGHAAYIAKLRAVPRVVLFGAPADGFNGQPAPWMQLGATPADRYYAFRHARDPFTSISPNWESLGLQQFGAPVNVDASTSAFSSSHLFITDLLPATQTYAHAHPSVFVDAVTPKRGDGTPVFEPLWRYLFGQ